MTTYLEEETTRVPREQASASARGAYEKWRTWQRERRLRSLCVRRQPCQPRRPTWYQPLVMRSAVENSPTGRERGRTERGGEQEDEEASAPDADRGSCVGMGAAERAGTRGWRDVGGWMCAHRARTDQVASSQGR